MDSSARLNRNCGASALLLPTQDCAPDRRLQTVRDAVLNLCSGKSCSAAQSGANAGAVSAAGESTFFSFEWQAIAPAFELFYEFVFRTYFLELTGKQLRRTFEVAVLVNINWTRNRVQFMLTSTGKSEKMSATRNRKREGCTQ